MTPVHLFHTLDLYAAHGNDDHLASAIRLAAGLVDGCKRQSSQNYSLFTGRAGVCYALLKLYEFTSDPIHIEKAKELMTTGGEAFLSSSYVPDALANGRAGVLWVLLQLYRYTEDATIKCRIDEYAKRIILQARPATGGGLYWEHPLEVNIQPLCSLAEGAAGVGLVFAQLAQYEGNDLAAWVAEQAFTYVAIQWDKHQAAWPDLRKGIRSGSDYRMHHEACLKGNIRFFEQPTENRSIMYGDAGILLCLVHAAAQPAYDHIIDRTWQSHFKQPRHNLLPRDPADHSLIAAHILLDAINSAPVQQHTQLITAILQPVSAGHCPQGGVTQPAAAGISLSLADARKEIVSRYFKRTISILEKTSFSQLSRHFQEPASGRENEIDRFISFMDQLLTDAADQSFQELLSEIFQLEKWKLEFIRTDGSRPFRWIREMCDYDAVVEQLNQGDEWLLQQSLVIARDVVIRQTKWNWSPTYDLAGNARDLSANLEVDASVYHLMFRKVAGEDLVETPMEALGPIVQCFSRGMKVETALQHITLFCQSQSPQALAGMIAQSNSRDKDDLLSRLPFLLLYQVKQLICDHVFDLIYS
jgi:hypothetical protein